MPGSASQRLKTVAPQVGQNDESVHRPELVIRRQLRYSPSIATTADSGKNAV
jgi:hypothetical protein